MDKKRYLGGSERNRKKQGRRMAVESSRERSQITQDFVESCLRLWMLLIVGSQWRVLEQKGFQMDVLKKKPGCVFSVG